MIRVSETAYRQNSINCFGSGSHHGTRFSVSVWNHCRESFHNGSNHAKPFVYRARRKADVPVTRAYLAEVAKFVGKPLVMEEAESGCIVIRPGPFWSEWMAATLLTILLRCGRYYDGSGDIFSPLRRSTYMRSHGSAYAARRFLEGHWRCLVVFDGWVETFSELNPEKIDAILR